LTSELLRDAAIDARPRASAPSLARKIERRLRAHRVFLLVVALPTLLVSLYFGLIATNQYEAEAHFIVRSSQDEPAAPTGLGQVLNFAGPMGEAQSESLSVGDYLSSHDAVAALSRDDQLVQRFRRPEIDFLSRLYPADPQAETLLKYYRRHVNVEYNSETGITTLRVRMFRPEDSYAVIGGLLKLGEHRVNDLNVRIYQETLAVANRQLEDAEGAVAHSQSSITGFRQSNQDIDPNGVGAAQIRLVSDLNGNLAQARAQLASMAGSIKSDSPQYRALTARIQALQAQVGAQTGRMASSGGRSIATDLGAFESLRMRQDFAAKRYASAAAALEQARDRAMKQELFVLRVVEPNLPQKSNYPKRLTIIATVFFGLLFVYSIGWLIVAGVKEHAS
jgi:capsular polysaccharide transport system permease protein